MNPDTVGDLFADLAYAIPALPRAACRLERAVFDSAEAADIERAVEICGNCLDREPCRRWALAQPPRSLLGVIAGELHSYNFRYDKKEIQTP